LEIQTVQFARLPLELLERWRLDHVAVRTEIPDALHVVFVTGGAQDANGNAFQLIAVNPPSVPTRTERGRRLCNRRPLFVSPN